MHSETELAVTVRDAVQTDLDNRTNIAILANYGQELERKKGFKALYTFSEQIHAYSYGIINTGSTPLIAQLDCSASKNMLFSTRNDVIKKRIDPGELEFMLHAMGLPSEDQFIRSAKCTVQEVKDRGRVI